MATQMTTTQDQLAKQQASLNDALNAHSEASKARAAEKPITWEEFYSAPSVSAPNPIDYQRERRNQNWAILADAINAVGSMATAGMGGNVTPLSSLTGANQQRFDAMYKQRMAQEEAYNKAVKDAESRAQNMASIRQQMRDRQNSLDIAAEQARINGEQTRVKQYQDAISQENTDRRLKMQEDNADMRLQKQMEADKNKRVADARKHNTEFRNTHYATPSVNGQQLWYPKEDADAFFKDAFDAIVGDAEFVAKYGLKDDIEKIRMSGLTDPKASNTSLRRFVNQNYGRSKAAQDATKWMMVDNDIWPIEGEQPQPVAQIQPANTESPGDNSIDWNTWPSSDPNKIYQPASYYK